MTSVQAGRYEALSFVRVPNKNHGRQKGSPYSFPFCCPWFPFKAALKGKASYQLQVAEPSFLPMGFDKQMPTSDQIHVTCDVPLMSHTAPLFAFHGH